MNYLLAGLGNIGAKRLALLGSRCVATVDPFNKAATHKDLREVNVKSFDAVILSVPNPVKLELLRLCLQMGKHVLIEKPLLFPDAETGHDLQKLAQSRQVIWYTSYNHRFEPLIEETKREMEAGVLGNLYHGRLFYGNGTAAHAAKSWRGEGLGVLEDLGPHLLDLAGHLLGCRGAEVERWSLEKHESTSLDHCLLATRDRRFVFEMSFLSWKNDFTIDLYGQRGSLHLKGLCKWGPSELVIQERVFPSGVPKERRKTVSGPDLTWRRDLETFEEAVASGRTSLENDQWISRVLNQVAA